MAGCWQVDWIGPFVARWTVPLCGWQGVWFTADRYCFKNSACLYNNWYTRSSHHTSARGSLLSWIILIASRSKRLFLNLQRRWWIILLGKKLPFYFVYVWRFHLTTGSSPTNICLKSCTLLQRLLHVDPLSFVLQLMRSSLILCNLLSVTFRFWDSIVKK